MFYVDVKLLILINVCFVFAALCDNRPIAYCCIAAVSFVIRHSQVHN